MAPGGPGEGGCGYFQPEAQVALYAALGMPVPSSEELSEVREDVLTYKSQLSRGRDARFKASVILGYHFTCSLTGYRLIASKSTYVPLEAAHARKGPDSPDNGLALTPTAHDLFDAGLWTVDDHLRIQVAHSDIAESILPGGSSSFSGRDQPRSRPIQLPVRMRLGRCDAMN